MKTLLRKSPFGTGHTATLLLHPRNVSMPPRRSQHNAVVGIRTEQHEGDEFEIIKEKTRALLEKPKVDRQPFLKNLFIKKIDPQILEYPEISKNAFDEIMRQVEPIASKVLKDVNSSDVDRASDIPDDVTAELGNSGAFVHRIPRTHWGNDLDMVGWTSLVESLSLGGNVSLGAWACSMGSWCARTISQHGTEEQKAFYLPQIADGKAAFSFCVSEAKSGSNVAAMETSVRMGPDNRGFILRGKKSWVINAGKADYFIVVAKHEGLGQTIHNPDVSVEQQRAAEKQQSGSMSAFIVSKKASGVTVGNVVPFVGLKGLQVSELILEETAISLDSLLGTVGQGFEIAMQAVTAERHVLAATAVPLLKKLMAETVRYATERKLFNRQITEFQMIKEKLAEVAFLTYGLESMMYLTSLLIDTTLNPEFDLESAAVRVFLGEAGPRCVRNCMEIFGASGLEPNCALEQASRDILTLCNIDGGTDIARLYVSLSGLQYAGMAYAQNIHERNNPFNYPNEMVRNFIMSKSLKKAKNQRKVFLEDYLHPTLAVAGQDTELACISFFHCVEGMLVEYHKKMLHRQIDLRRISEMAVLIYGAFASLGRASRSYCNGIKHNQQEISLALLFVNHAKQRIDMIYNEITTVGVARDELILKVADHMVTQQSYGVEHPLSRVF